MPRDVVVRVNMKALTQQSLGEMQLSLENETVVRTKKYQFDTHCFAIYFILHTFQSLHF